jgi:hypothetical protein
MPAGPKNAAALRVIPEDDAGLTLEDLFSDTVTVETTIKGKRLEITWAPARYTPVVEESSLAMTAGTTDDEIDESVPEEERERLTAERLRAENKAIREFLSNVLVSWTLRRADGAEVDTDVETLRSLPQPFLREVFGAIVGNAGPKGETAPASGPSSSPTA